jgi:cytochrome c-type biogenesis protein CcmF
VYRPAVSQFGSDSEGIGTPSVASSLTSDVYLTFDSPPDGATVGGSPAPSIVSGQSGSGSGGATTRSGAAGAATIGVVVQPMVAWLWIGGAVMALGTLLAALPERRRRAARGDQQEPTGAGTEPAEAEPALELQPELEPVAAPSGGGS